MIAEFKPCTLNGYIDAPPSKSMAHRYLIGAALSKKKCTVTGVDFSEDILATIDCLKALGAKITTNKDTVTVECEGFSKDEYSVLNCRESGSTLRFFIPLALCLGKKVSFEGSSRLLERPLDVFEEFCQSSGFLFEKAKNSLTICGNLKSGEYKIRGDISSQFITGLIFALVYLGGDSKVHIIPPFESKSYVNLTISALKAFGISIDFIDEYTVSIKPSTMHSFSGKVEGDCSNAAFLDAFNYTGSKVTVANLNPDTLQGDRIYKEYFDKISNGTPTLDISDCPDLGPVLIALASLKNGAVFTGTRRLKAKESDRGMAMCLELQKLGVMLKTEDNSIIVPKQNPRYSDIALSGHNDHRIVMALSLILSNTGGIIEGCEAVKKSYPGFFDDIIRLGAKVNLK